MSKIQDGAKTTERIEEDAKRALPALRVVVGGGFYVLNVDGVFYFFV
jgi:hypothetical protein